MNQNKINVTLVDDDESFACALERLLRASGFNVRTFPSAESFLAGAMHPPPACLVLDIQLGGMSGLDLQRRLGEIRNPPPIIFVTAHDAPGVRAEAERGGCSAYFLKPVPGKSLIEAINKAVNTSVLKSRNQAANKPE
jgi:FixJ family two-component response regulator